MIDFLKANPFVSKEEYLWEWTVPQIKLATIDTTHIEYSKSKDKGKKGKKGTTAPENVMKLDSPEAIDAWVKSNGSKKYM